MRIDFYQLSRDPAERVVPLLAGKAIEGGGRLIVVHGDPAWRTMVSSALWSRDGAFLAHGDAGAPHAERQPILLAEDAAAANGAGMVILADGEWRAEAAGFERTILLFGADQTEIARGLWSTLSESGHELRIFKQGTTGGWREGR